MIFFRDSGRILMDSSENLFRMFVKEGIVDTRSRLTFSGERPGTEPRVMNEHFVCDSLEFESAN
jgi:hypothetical protein